MWVDVIVEDVLASRPADRYVVNDAWSPSGPAHMGSLRGVVLHDSIAKALADRGRQASFLYGFDDYDPVDGIPASAPPGFDQYLGQPQSEVPSPAGGAESFARYFGDGFARVVMRLGITPQIYWTSEMYKAGQFDEMIHLCLDRLEEIIRIDREISRSERWHPVQVLCGQCGRIGTTVVTAWDGREVGYECRPDKVTWARGCGHRGTRSPFRGGSKLQYKAEWAAKWKILGVDVEGAGKDHMVRGGSHDVASAIAERVLHYRTPYPVAYEFFLVGGRKMASSKGLGMQAADLVEILGPELARFLMVRPHYKQQINFDPAGETIPTLYDEYDRAAAAYFGEREGKTPAETELLRDHGRTFYFSRTDGEQTRAFRMRFSKVAYLLQMPAVNIEEVAATEKGGPLTAADRAELNRRIADARRWLRSYAPDHYRFQVQPALPPVALSPDQRRFLGELAAALERRDHWPGDELHAQVHALKNTLGLPAKEAFAAIYLAFLGKPSGPQAGWFLASLERGFVLSRLRDAAGVQ